MLLYVTNRKLIIYKSNCNKNDNKNKLTTHTKKQQQQIVSGFMNLIKILKKALIMLFCKMKFKHSFQKLYRPQLNEYLQKL